MIVEATTEGVGGFKVDGDCWHEYKECHVYLDGVEQMWAEFADDAAGVVRRNIEDENGFLKHDQGEWLVEEVRGQVRIELVR